MVTKHIGLMFLLFIYIEALLVMFALYMYYLFIYFHYVHCEYSACFQLIIRIFVSLNPYIVLKTQLESDI